jgi:nucleoid-associated protein YgaU
MNRAAAADRAPGPTELYEVSISAQRRWLEDSEALRDGKRYRPATLSHVTDALNRLSPDAYGIGGVPEELRNSCDLYDVRAGDTLSGIALQFYGSAKEWERIFRANLNKLDHPDRIYVGQQLRIPKGENSHNGDNSRPREQEQV